MNETGSTKNSGTWQSLAEKHGQSGPLALILDWYYRRKIPINTMATDLDVAPWELFNLMGRLDLPLRKRDLKEKGGD